MFQRKWKNECRSDRRAPPLAEGTLAHSSTSTSVPKTSATVPASRRLSCRTHACSFHTCARFHTQAHPPVPATHRKASDVSGCAGTTPACFSGHDLHVQPSTTTHPLSEENLSEGRFLVPRSRMWASSMFPIFVSIPSATQSHWS